MIAIHRSIGRLVLPNYCLLCKEPTHSRLALCESCIQTLPWSDLSCCQYCAIPLPEPQICGYCQTNPPPFTRVTAPLLYTPPIDRFIARLKFGHKLIYAQLLASLFYQYLVKSQTPLPEAIIPVPLHPKRLRQRGFNQASLIAQVLAKKLRLPCLHFATQRIKHTQPQAQLKEKSRLHNVKNAFKLTKPIAYKHIALLDDVMTTSATARQLCLVLKQKYLTEIQIWVCARATK